MFKSLYVFSLLFVCPFAQAKCNVSFSVVNTACSHITSTWQDGDDDLYLPFYAKHLNFAYSTDKINAYNERSFGLGYGRSHYLQNGNWEGLFGMAFLDSHNDVEPMVGYAYQWMWGPKQSLHAGLGYTVFITARSDIHHYLPFPAALPIASINYKRFSINTTYIPGGQGFGNVLFFWSKFGF
jgi:lipid IVA palmitoyltransferase